MIKSSEQFIFNNHNSSDYNIFNISIQEGLYEEPFLPSTEIVEIYIKYKDSPYFQRKKNHPLEFTVNFGFADAWDKSALSELARIFMVDFYAPLIFSEDPDKIYYVLPIGDIKITHQGTIGYITMQFRCAYPYALSPTYSSPLYDYSNNTSSGTQLTFVNNGDLSLFPILNVQIINGDSFSIQNLNNNNQIISFSGLTISENLVIDCENEDISTDQPLTYRYSNMSGDFLELLRGVNNLLIKGNIKFQFIYEYKILQS